MPPRLRFSAACAVAAVCISTGMAVGSSPSTADATREVVLRGTIPAAVRHATRLGAAAPSTPLHLALLLHRQNPAALDAAVRAVTTPGSPRFHHFLSTAEFGRRYGAPAADVRSVIHRLAAAGIRATAPPNHLLVQANTTAGVADRVFDAGISRLRAYGRTFLANTRNVRLPADLAGLVDGVVGLDTSNIRTPLARVAAQRPMVANYSPTPATYKCPQAKTLSGSGYTAEDLSAAYDFSGLYRQGLHGEGMSIALVEYADYRTSDVRAFESCYGITGNPVARRYVDGGADAPIDANTGGEGEALLDIDVALEMLPKIAHVYVYEAPNTDTSELDLYSAFVNDRRAPVLSSSWGYCEDGLGAGYADAYTALTEEADVQGQQILDASGDSGSQDCFISAPPLSTTLTTELQSTDPYNTSVGGTSLYYPAANQTETAWNGTAGAGGAIGGSGGGGISKYYALPSYQRPVANASRQTGAQARRTCGASQCRLVPDLSADADPLPGYAIYCTDCALAAGSPATAWTAIGGTSASTPLMSSMLTLIDQDARRHGLRTIGFLNPLLYRIYADKRAYARDFYDVTRGSNDNGGAANGHYPATTGYDLATGLGTPDAARLAADLLKLSSRLVAVPNTLTAYGYLPGPATTHTIAVTSGLRRVRIHTRTDQPWLRVHAPARAPGTLRIVTRPRGLHKGNHVGHVTVTSSAGRLRLTVTYIVTPRARLRVTPGRLAFHEGVLASGSGSSSQSCDSQWNDEFDNPGHQDPGSLRAFTIRNSGPKGSVLHYTTTLVTRTGGLWLNYDGRVPTHGPGPAIATGGRLASGHRVRIPLAAGASLNAPGLPPGTWTGRIGVRDLADPSQVRTVQATLATGNGRRTPVLAASVNHITVTLAPGQTVTRTVALRDATGGCGFSYSSATSQRWIYQNDPGYAGTVTPGTAPGRGTGLLTLHITTRGLSHGVHRGAVMVTSTQVTDQPFQIPVTVRVH